MANSKSLKFAKEVYLIIGGKNFGPSSFSSFIRTSIVIACQKLNIARNFPIVILPVILVAFQNCEDIGSKPFSAATAPPPQVSVTVPDPSSQSTTNSGAVPEIVIHCVGDGIADDTKCLQEGINRAIGKPLGDKVGLPYDSFLGTTIRIPPGIYQIKTTITVGPAFGLRIVGSGPQTTIMWSGNSDDPGISVDDCDKCELENFRYVAVKANSMAFRLQTSSAAVGITSSQNEFRSIIVDGTASKYLTDGFRVLVGNAGDVNNDVHRFDRVWVNGYRNSAWSLEGGNVHAINFYDCVFFGGAYGITSRSYYPRVANFMWRGGFGTATEASFYLGDAAAQGTISIDGFQAEETPVLLDVLATNENHSILNYENVVRISGVRFMSQNLHVDGPDGFGYVVKYQNPSQLIIENSSFGFARSDLLDKKMAFYYAPNVAVGSPSPESLVKRSFTFQNNTINGAYTTVEQLFPVEKPTLMSGNVYRTSSTSGWIGSSIMTVSAPGKFAQISVQNASTNGNGVSGINYRIDQTDIWQTITDNTPSVDGAKNYDQNAFFLQFANNPNLRYLKVDTRGNVTILNPGANVYLASGAGILSGPGDPRNLAGVSTAPVGSMYLRTDGGAGSTFYIKEPSGWVGK